MRVALLSAHLLSLVSRGQTATTAFQSSCRSNATHIAWQQQQPGVSDILDSPSNENADEECCCEWQLLAEAELESYDYLRKHVMAFDLPFLSTLGFADGGDLPDGLGGGMIGPTIQYALKAKGIFQYCDDLPKEIWQEYVLNYANLNEARNNWRPLLWENLEYLLIDSETNEPNVTGISEAVLQLNTHMWTSIAPKGVDSIKFVSGQCPLIFDAISVLAFGYASCTGLAVLFSDALRTFGVPARVAGTPAWYQDREQGNHNWVEVWKDGQWYFLEPSPAQSVVDSLERNPCERWFCSSSRFSSTANTTLAYAAALDTSDTFFRLAWEWNNQEVPGVYRTTYYREVCASCDYSLDVEASLE